LIAGGGGFDSSSDEDDGTMPKRFQIKIKPKNENENENENHDMLNSLKVCFSLFSFFFKKKTMNENFPFFLLLSFRLSV